MRALNILTTMLIILTFIILVDMGHSALPLGFMEILLIPYSFTSRIPSSGHHDIIFISFIIAAMVGHITLLLSLVRRYIRYKIILLSVGQFLLLSTIIFLLKFNTGVFDRLAFWWSIPALLNMITLAIYIYFGKQYWQNKNIMQRKDSNL